MILVDGAWSAISGARKYLSAMARGDIAGEDVQYERAQTCARCESVKLYSLPVIGQYGTCGKQFEGTEDTCGCLVLTVSAQDVVSGLPIDLAAKPAGKVCVGSERCPQGRW